MKNNKGFTLVELLVAVAIMLTLLGIAIISFTTISSRKKTEAWESVKNQIETAAEMYFKSNEFLFEGLDDSRGISGTITVGKLVESDYLNKVVDPRSGNSVPFCTEVNVTKNNGIFNIAINDDVNKLDNSDSCKATNSIVVSETGAPKVSIKSLCGGDIVHNGTWCTKKTNGGQQFELTKDPNGYGAIVDDEEVMYIDNSESTDVNKKNSNFSTSTYGFSRNKSNNTYSTTKETTKQYYAHFIVKNTDGRKTCATVKYGVDYTKPTVSVTASDADTPIIKKKSDMQGNTEFKIQGWRNKSITFTYSSKDESSGIDKNGITWNWNEAGADNNNYLQTPKIKYTGNLTRDAINGIGSFESDGYRKGKWIVKDKAGNETTITVKVNIDTKKPTVYVTALDYYKRSNVVKRKSKEFSGTGTYTVDSNWISQSVFFDYDSEDPMSGIRSKTWYYNASNSPTDTGNNYMSESKTADESWLVGEGYRKGKWVVEDNAGNKTEVTVKVLIDKTAPSGSIDVKSISSNYNDKNVNVSGILSDNLSGIKTITSTPSFTINASGNKYEKTISLSNKSLFSDYTGGIKTFKLVVTDEAGHESTFTKDYTVYKKCDQTIKDGNVIKSTWTTCPACGGGNRSQTVTQKYKDKYLGVSCGQTQTVSNESCTYTPCSLSCPTVSAEKYYTKNGTLYNVNAKNTDFKISHNGAAGKWTWYRDGVSLGKTTNSITLSDILENTHGYTLRGPNGENCDAATVYYDKTPPECHIEVSGTKGNNNWYLSNVGLTVNTSSTDVATGDNSNFSLSNQNKAAYSTKSINHTEDTTSAGVRYYGKVKDKSGNEGSCETSIKVDKTPPTITITSLRYEFVRDLTSDYPTEETIYDESDFTKSSDGSDKKVEIIANRNYQILSFGDIKYGATFGCVYEGQSEDKASGSSENYIIRNHCDGGSTVSSRDDASGVYKRYLSILPLTNNDDFNHGGSNQSNPYPFPSQACAFAVDNAGNISKASPSSCLRVFFVYDNGTKSSRNWNNNVTYSGGKWNISNGLKNSSCWTNSYPYPNPYSCFVGKGFATK